MRIFNKEMYNWYHREIYVPLTTPLQDNWMDEMTEEDWKRSEGCTREIMTKINRIS